MWLGLGPDFARYFLRRTTSLACGSACEYGSYRCVDRHFHENCRCDPLLFATATRALLMRRQQSYADKSYADKYRADALYRVVNSNRLRLRRLSLDAIKSSYSRRMLYDMMSFLDFQLVAGERAASRRRMQVLHRMRGACARALRCSTQWRPRFFLLAKADTELRVSCPWWWKIQPEG